MKTNKLFTIIICFVLLGNACIAQQASEEMLVAFKPRALEIVSKQNKQKLKSFKRLHYADSVMKIVMEFNVYRYTVTYSWDQKNAVTQFLINAFPDDKAYNIPEHRLLFMVNKNLPYGELKLRWVANIDSNLLFTHPSNKL